LLGDGDEVLRLARRDGVVESVSGRNGTDEDEHDKTHALLAVIGTVEKN
jgi:hypothetical protein